MNALVGRLIAPPPIRTTYCSPRSAAHAYLTGVQAGGQLRLLTGRIECPVKRFGRRRGVHLALQHQRLVLEGAEQFVVRGHAGGRNCGSGRRQIDGVSTIARDRLCNRLVIQRSAYCIISREHNKKNTHEWNKKKHKSTPALRARNAAAARTYIARAA